MHIGACVICVRTWHSYVVSLDLCVYNRRATWYLDIIKTLHIRPSNYNDSEKDWFPMATDVLVFLQSGTFARSWPTIHLLRTVFCGSIFRLFCVPLLTLGAPDTIVSILSAVEWTTVLLYNVDGSVYRYRTDIVIFRNEQLGYPLLRQTIKHLEMSNSNSHAQLTVGLLRLGYRLMARYGKLNVNGMKISLRVLLFEYFLLKSIVTMSANFFVEMIETVTISIQLFFCF